MLVPVPFIIFVVTVMRNDSPLKGPSGSYHTRKSLLIILSSLKVLNEAGFIRDQEQERWIRYRSSYSRAFPIIVAKTSSCGTGLIAAGDKK